MSKVGAASLVGVPAIFNGAGRVLWGWLSDLPSTAGQFFGVRFAGAIYGLVLVAWSLGGIVGPLLISKLIGENRQYTLGFTVIGIIALVALVVPLITRSRPTDPRSAPSGRCRHAERRPPPCTCSCASRSPVAAATASTACSKAAALCAAGWRNPLILRTYCRAAARTSSSPTFSV
jgi:hypothetical protein